MTRKDYIRVAEIIYGHLGDVRSDDPPDAEMVIDSIAGMLADMFEQDNSAFDRDRFFVACGFRLTETGWS